LFYYNVSLIAKNSNPDKIYSLELQQQNLEKIVEAPVKKLGAYLYPPHSMLFFAPLANFSAKGAFIFWQVGSIIATLAIIAMLVLDRVCKNKPTDLLIAALLIVSSSAWITTILQGQVTILMAIGLFASFLLAKSNKFIWAGLLIVLFSFKPQVFFAPVIFLLIMFGKNLFISSFIVGIITISICSAIFGLDIWKSYLDVLLFASSESESGTNLIGMCNIRALVFLLFGSENMAMINGVSILIWLVSILFSIYLGFKAKGKTEKTQDLAFGVTVALGCLFGPWSHIYSLFLLIIPVSYLVKYYNFKSAYHCVGGMVNFGLLTLFIATLKEELNSVIWVPAQLILIYLLIRLMIKEHKKTFVPVVS
jgi:hypothetical protein